MSFGFNVINPSGVVILDDTNFQVHSVVVPVAAGISSIPYNPTFICAGVKGHQLNSFASWTTATAHFVQVGAACNIHLLYGGPKAGANNGYGIEVYADNGMTTFSSAANYFNVVSLFNIMEYGYEWDNFPALDSPRGINPESVYCMTFCRDLHRFIDDGVGYNRLTVTKSRVFLANAGGTMGVSQTKPHATFATYGKNALIQRDKRIAGIVELRG